MVEFVRQNPAHPIVQGMLPGVTLPLTLAMWEEHTRMLRVLDELPHTFCHQDAFGRNLFYRSQQVVAIDWGYAGIAPVGAALAPPVGVTFGLAGFPSSQAEEEGIGASPEEAGKSDAGEISYYQSIAMEALKLLGLRCISRVISPIGRCRGNRAVDPER